MLSQDTKRSHGLSSSPVSSQVAKRTAVQSADRGVKNPAVELPSEPSDDAQFKLRSYQQEMVDESMQRNIIVAMDTGSGKTQIAIARAQATLEKCAEDKMVWLLAPTVSLCDQHYDLFQKCLPAYQTRLLTGNDGVDKWSSQEIWDDALFNIRIVICTHAVLHDALTFGFVSMQRIALIVFDEAHHCVQSHPARKIMAKFYLPRLLAGEEELPAILGLTASPVNSAHLSDMEALEANLNARIVSPKAFRPELLTFVHRPRLIKAIHPISNSGESRLLDLLSHIFFSYDISRDPYFLSISETDEDLRRRIKTTRKTYCQEQLKKLYTSAERILQQLGAYAANLYIATCVNRFLDAARNTTQQVLKPSLEDLEMIHVVEILNQIKPHFPDINEDRSLDLVAPGLMAGLSSKVEHLVKILHDEWSPTFTGLIFVQERAVVQILVRILSTHPTIMAKFQVEGYVGTSSNPRKRKRMAELAEPKSQLSTLSDFRAGKINLLVTTAVLEEGIDVPTCHIVVCFDKPTTLKSYIQRRGRARQKDSKYVMMFPYGDPSLDGDAWMRLEEEMETAYLSHERAVKQAQQREAVVEQQQRIFETPKATLTLDVAGPCLYHFCDTLNAGAFIDLRPQFAFERDGSLGLVTAVVTLPTVIAPLLRSTRSSKAYLTERVAKMDAAFESCVALFRAGLLNDNLMPRIKTVEEQSTEGIEEKASFRTVQPRLNPWVPIAQIHEHERVWHRLRITLVGEHERTSIFMCSPARIPTIPSFPLYWNKEIQYRIETQAVEPCTYNEDDMMAAQQITRRLYLPGHVSRLQPEQSDFLFYFLPEIDIATSIFLHPWAATLSEEDRKPDEIRRLKSGGHAVDAGIIKHFSGERYFFKYFTETQSLLPESTPKTANGYQQVVVTNITKRRDFLHPIPESEHPWALSRETFLPLDECTFGNVPLSYCKMSFFIPSILRRIEIALVAEELGSTILKPVNIQDLSIIQTALCHNSAREGENYQRLEFLGDCILKYYTSLQVIAEHPNWPEGYLAQAKDRRVCNSALEVASRRIGLDRFIIADPFTGAKWRPHYIEEILTASKEPAKEVNRSSKMLADVVESSIGASYFGGGLLKAQHCIEIFFPQNTWVQTKDALKLIANAAIGDAIQLGSLERLVGYTFRNPKLITEAITHASFQSYQGATVRSYETLEFLGDPVLDYLVVRRLFKHEKPLPHDVLHGIRTAVVNSWILGFLCMEHGITEQIKDIQLQGDDGGKLITRSRDVQRHIWQYMRHSAREITNEQEATQKRYTDMREEILSELNTGARYPWSRLSQFGPNKLFSDLVESILSAIYVDTEGDFEECDRFLERLGLWEILDRILRDEVDCLHPKARLGHLAVAKKVEYVRRIDEESKRMKCQIKVGGEDVGDEVEGYLRVDVETEAAAKAVEVLEDMLKKSRLEKDW